MLLIIYQVGGHDLWVHHQQIKSMTCVVKEFICVNDNKPHSAAANTTPSMTKKAEIPSPTQNLTMHQAIQTAYSEALRWSVQARLTYVISTDMGENNGSNNSGKNGRRANWNVIFVNPKTKRNLLVAVRQGKPQYVKEVQMAFKNPINIKDLHYDSPTALQMVTTSKKENRESFDSFHFELVHLSIPVLRVYQRLESGGYTITSINQKTGRIIHIKDGG